MHISTVRLTYMYIDKRIKKIAPCNLVLYVEVSDDTMKERLMKRGLSSGRVDDNEETIKKRLETFHAVTQPVIDYYDEKGKLRRVNAEQDADAVFGDIEKILDAEFGAPKNANKKDDEDKARKEKEEKERKEKEEKERKEKEEKERKEKEEKERKEKEKKEKEEKEKKEKEEKERKAAEKAAEEKRKKIKEKLDKERKTKQAEAQKKLKDSKVVFVTGGPGSGKTTQAEKMAAEFDLTHLSCDDLIQKDINSGSDRGQLLNDLIQKGGADAVPKELVLDVIRDAMMAQADKTGGFIVDGFPKKLDQGVDFDKNVRILLSFYSYIVIIFH